jgi:ATP-dependent DNA helicase RecG
VLVDHLGERSATLYGILCFGRDPQRFRHTGSFYVDCVAYAGVDRSSSVLLGGEAKGRVDEQVTRAIGWLRSLGTREDYAELHRREVPIVPEKAIREVLVNAVAHRDYSIIGTKILFEVFADRLVVTSPGTLPNQMTEAGVLAGAHPRSRNESVANFLLVARLMDGRGRGFPTIRREMEAFNGTAPELRNDRDNRFVRVTLQRGGARPSVISMTSG